MKKDIQRAALAAIVGTLAVMTGCDRNDSDKKDQDKNGQMQEQPMRQDGDQSAKPMPNGDQGNGPQYHTYCE